MQPKTPLTADQQIAEILASEVSSERKKTAISIATQLYVAVSISLIFFAIIWYKSGFSWAISNVLLSDVGILTLAIGNPWRWLFHHKDPDFQVSTTSRIISWLFLLLSLLLSLIISPSSLSTLNQSAASLQQAEQLQQELGN